MITELQQLDTIRLSMKPKTKQDQFWPIQQELCHQDASIQHYANPCQNKIQLIKPSTYTFFFLFLDSDKYFNLMYIVHNHTIIKSLFIVLGRWLASSRFSSDLAFLFRTLPASFSSSANLFFSSSTSGFAVPSFSSLTPTMYSSIWIASSNLQRASRSSCSWKKRRALQNHDR